MPTDLTGTPTSLGIGTYNVDADAPSGLGFNAAMAQIDALIVSRLATPAGIATGEVPVWNGSTWVRSSTLGMSPAGISGYPNTIAKFLRGDGAWSQLGVYRKTTTKQVVNTVTETDLLNGEVTVGAGVMGTNGVIRLTASGDWLNNSGSTQATPRFKLKLGASTLIDSNVIATSWLSSAGTFGWKFVAEIANKGATNSQWIDLDGRFTGSLANNLFVNPTAGEGMTSTTSADMGIMTIVNSSSVDTTVAQALALTVTLPAASASLVINLARATVELL